MSNKREYQFIRSKVPELTVRVGNITIGGSGSVASSSSGTGGVASVTKLTTGIYQIKLVDNFPFYIGSTFTFRSGTSGAAVGDGTLVANTLYQILTVGNSNWVTNGMDSQYTAAVGVPFVASGTGDGAATGTAKAVATAGSAIYTVEVVQDTTKLLTNNYPNMNTGTQGKGSSFIIQCLGPTGGTTSASTTLIPANPAAGSILEFEIFLRNSTAQAV